MKMQVICAVIAATVSIQALADSIQELKAHEGVYLLKNPMESRCGTTRLTLGVSGNDVQIREVGNYVAGGQAYDLVFSYKGVNTNRVESISYPNAVDEIQRVVFQRGDLKIQSKKRSVLFPTPWMFIPWKDERMIFSLHQLLKTEGECQMVKI